jgi:hypothetical protein
MFGEILWVVAIFFSRVTDMSMARVEMENGKLLTYTRSVNGCRKF